VEEMKKLLRSPKEAAAVAGLIALVLLVALIVAVGERMPRRDGLAPDGTTFEGPSDPPPGFVPGSGTTDTESAGAEEALEEPVPVETDGNGVPALE
jgi:hypothetical protein